MSAPNVLGGEAIFNKNGACQIGNHAYRDAVAEIIRTVKFKHKLTNIQLADLVGCSDGTISNAENAHGSLDPNTLIRMANVFGPQIMQPIRDIYDRPLTYAEQIDDICERLQALKVQR